MTTDMTLPNPIQAMVPVVSNSGVEHEFCAGINTMTKKIGWRPKHMPGFDPVDALTTVHDCFEHFPKTEVGGIQDELLAQGAMLWLRLEGGYFGEFGSSNFDLDSMLKRQVPPAWGMLYATALARRMAKQDAPMLDESVKPLPTRTEGVLMRIIATADDLIGKTGIWGSFEGRLCNLDLSQIRMLREVVMNSAPWIRLGYRLAAKRYEGLDKRRLVRLFNMTIEKVAASLLMEESIRTHRGEGEHSVLRLKIEPECYRSTVTTCVETLAPGLTVAEQDKLNLLHDDELEGTFS